MLLFSPTRILDSFGILKSIKNILTRSPNIKHPHENRYYTYLKPFWWRFIDEISPTAGEAATKNQAIFRLAKAPFSW